MNRDECSRGENLTLHALLTTSFDECAQIAEVAKQGNYDLVFTGKETIDYNGSSIGGMVAELLDHPYVSLATKFDISGNKATIVREIAATATVAIIEHDIDFVRGLADDVTVLHKGRVMREGTIAEIEGDAEVRRVYLGDA